MVLKWKCFIKGEHHPIYPGYLTLMEMAKFPKKGAKIFKKATNGWNPKNQTEYQKFIEMIGNGIYSTS